jgi:hypothetical protein
MEADGGNFDTKPFCDIDTPTGAGGNDGRGDILEDDSFEGETLRDDGPLMLQRPISISVSPQHRFLN